MPCSTKLASVLQVTFSSSLSCQHVRLVNEEKLRSSRHWSSLVTGDRRRHDGKRFSIGPLVSATNRDPSVNKGFMTSGSNGTPEQLRVSLPLLKVSLFVSQGLKYFQGRYFLFSRLVTYAMRSFVLKALDSKQFCIKAAIITRTNHTREITVWDELFQVSNDLRGEQRVNIIEERVVKDKLELICFRYRSEALLATNEGGKGHLHLGRCQQYKKND